MSRVSRLVDFVRKNTTFVDWGVILLLAFLPFWNVGWGVWEAYDQGFPLIPANELFRSLFAWNDLAGAGGPNGIVTSVFLPFKLLTTMLASSGLGLGLVQRFIDVVMFAASGWGMYYLETVIFHFGDSGAKRVAAMLAAVFYMFNLFIVYWMMIGAFPEYPIIALPFALAFVYKGMNSSGLERPFAYSLLFCLSIVFLATVPEFLIVSSLPIVCLVAYLILRDALVRHWRLAKSKLTFVTMTAILLVLTNSYWIIVNAYSLFALNSINRAVSLSPGLQRVLTFYSVPAGLIQSFRTIAWIVPTNNPTTLLTFYVVSPLWMILGLFIFVVALSTLVLLPRMKGPISLAAIAIVSVGMASGIEPFREMYLWLFANVSIFGILSDPHKFLLLTSLATSALFGLAAAEILRRTHSKRLARATAFILVGLILVNSYPLLDGNMFGALTGVNVPGYYEDSSQWFAAQGSNYRIMALPSNLPGTSTGYTWAPYAIAGGIYWATGLFPVSVFNIDTTPVNPAWWASTAIDNVISENLTTHLGKILTLWNIKYVIISHDNANPSTNGQIPVGSLVSFVNRQTDIRYLQSFGKLDIYLNRAWNDTTFYASSVYVTLGQQFNLTTLEFLASEVPDILPTGVVMVSSPFPSDIMTAQVLDLSGYSKNASQPDLSKLNETLLGQGRPQITYTKLDSSDYVVHIVGTRPSVLVFESTFDPTWSATIAGFKGPLDHFEVDNYANGWYVPISGSVTIAIHNTAQPYLADGLLVSEISWVACVVILFAIPILKVRVRKSAS